MEWTPIKKKQKQKLGSGITNRKAMEGNKENEKADWISLFLNMLTLREVYLGLVKRLYGVFC